MTVKMLSKVAFASLAFACVDAAYAAVIDTTGTTNVLVAQNTYIGSGTLEVSGGTIWLGGSGGDPITEFAMTGGLIDIVSGTTLKNGGWQKGVWTANKAGMQVNGTLDVFDGNNIFADALTGSGTMTIGDISWTTVYKSITVGVNGGGGTFTGTISDSGDDTVSLIKTNGGTQILTGPNTYRGATTINGGTLMLQDAAFSTTARAYLIASNAVLNIDGNTGVAPGTTTISGDGTLLISGGTLNSGADGRDLTLALGSGAVIEIQPEASMANGGWQNMTWSGNLADMQVDGTLNLSDGNTVFIDALTGTGTVNKTYWNPDGYDTRTLTVGQDGGSGTFSGIITQAKAIHVAALTKNGGGTQIPTGANNYSGATTINGGTLKLQGAAFSTTARAYLIASNAVLNLDGNTGVAWGNTTISGTGTLRISGGGLSSGADGRDLTLELGSGALIDIQSGASMYNGGWQNMTWTGNKASLQVDGTLDLSDGNNIFADALTGSGTVTMGDLSWGSYNKSITVGVNGGGGTFTGTISDSGDDTVSLIKTGGGTQILTGVNTYRGATTINGGTLRIDGNSSGVLGALTVEAGAFLGGNGSYGGNITLNSGAALNCELNLTDSTLTCGQLSFTSLDFTNCSFTVASGAGYPPFRRIPLIQAASLGTTTFANGASSTEGTIAGVPANLYLKDNILMLDFGYIPGMLISIF